MKKKGRFRGIELLERHYSINNNWTISKLYIELSSLMRVTNELCIADVDVNTRKSKLNQLIGEEREFLQKLIDSTEIAQSKVIIKTEEKEDDPISKTPIKQEKTHTLLFKTPTTRSASKRSVIADTRISDVDENLDQDISMDVQCTEGSELPASAADKDRAAADKDRAAADKNRAAAETDGVTASNSSPEDQQQQELIFIYGLPNESNIDLASSEAADYDSIVSKDTSSETDVMAVEQPEQSEDLQSTNPLDDEDDDFVDDENDADYTMDNEADAALSKSGAVMSESKARKKSKVTLQKKNKKDTLKCFLEDIVWAKGLLNTTDNISYSVPFKKKKLNVGRAPDAAGNQDGINQTSNFDRSSSLPNEPSSPNCDTKPEPRIHAHVQTKNYSRQNGAPDFKRDQDSTVNQMPVFDISSSLPNEPSSPNCDTDPEPRIHAHDQTKNYSHQNGGKSKMIPSSNAWSSKEYTSSDELYSSESEYLPSENSSHNSYDCEVINESEGEESEASEIFPMLCKPLEVPSKSTKKTTGTISSKVSSRNLDVLNTSDSEDESPDEDSILRDKDNPEIYVYKILKATTSKTGQMKKIDRVYNSYQYCALCKIKVSNFSQHITRNRSLLSHSNSKELTEILNEDDPKQSKDLKTLLRGKFNNEFNMKTLARGKGEIILERRPSSYFKVAEYGPCPGCSLWISKRLLRKHKEKCASEKSIEVDSTSALVTQSDVLCGRIQPIASQTLLQEVFTSMNLDEIGKIAREDSLIVQLGNQWIEKNVGNKLKRGTYTSQIMRLCGRLLLNLRKIKPLADQENLWNYLKPNYFDDIVRATLLTADVISDDNLEKPSNARKLGFDIKRLIKGKISLSIMNNDSQSRTEAEDLLKKIEIFWGTRVAKLANVLLEERRYKKNAILPIPEDIQKLNVSLESSILNLDLDPEHCCYEQFLKVVEVVSVKLVVYNRRRSGEIQAIRLHDYENRKKGEAPEHLVGELTMFEKKLLESQEVMTVRGMAGRGVPVIIPSIIKEPLLYLTNPVIRSRSSIKATNRYIFAGKGDGIVKVYDSLVKACREAELQLPELVTSTNLRKYMATVIQVLDLKKNEMEWVLNHLGHSMEVHKIHYRHTSDVIERAQVAKLLLMQDNDKIGDFQHMSLNEIQMEDIVFGEKERLETDLFVEAENLSEEKTTETPKKPKRRPVHICKKWSCAEEDEIRKLFKKHLDTISRPLPKDCEKAINMSKKSGGILWKRKKDVLKKKLFRMVDALKKKSQ